MNYEKTVIFILCISTSGSDRVGLMTDSDAILLTIYFPLSKSCFMPIGDPSLQTHNLALCNGVLYYTAGYFIGEGCEPYFIDQSLSNSVFGNENVSYWPNPFTEALHIRSNEPIEKVNIYNIKGQRLFPPPQVRSVKT